MSKREQWYIDRDSMTATEVNVGRGDKPDWFKIVVDDPQKQEAAVNAVLGSLRFMERFQRNAMRLAMQANGPWPKISEAEDAKLDAFIGFMGDVGRALLMIGGRPWMGRTDLDTPEAKAEIGADSAALEDETLVAPPADGVN